MGGTRNFAWGIKETEAEVTGREPLRDSEGVGLRENNPSAGVPGNSTERLMRSLSVPAKSRPENAISPLLRGLFSLSPTDLCIIHLSLPASRTPFSGQVVKKSTGTWLHKEVEEHKWTSVGELRTLEKTIVF